MVRDAESKAEICPVDQATRIAWLDSQSSKTAPPLVRAVGGTGKINSSSYVMDQSDRLISLPESRIRKFWDSLTTWPAPPEDRVSRNNHDIKNRANITSLSHDREVSTIPRTEYSQLEKSLSSKNDEIRVTQQQSPANCERESGVSSQGNWIYPSEKMFYEAISRKGYISEARDMKTIVPIHNAVNEKTWKEIKDWEESWGGEKCGGPKLHSFKGLSSSMTPKARLNTWLGYMAPFDRHDWIIDRCGKRVEYVIDFYAGKNQGNGKLNFFLDVRPKLNTWEGLKMRVAKFLGLA